MKKSITTSVLFLLAIILFTFSINREIDNLGALALFLSFVLTIYGTIGILSKLSISNN
jgi:hypothetical protein